MPLYMLMGVLCP